MDDDCIFNTCWNSIFTIKAHIWQIVYQRRISKCGKNISNKHYQKHNVNINPNFYNKVEDEQTDLAETNIIRDASSTKESDASGSDSLRSLAEASNGELDTSDSDDNELIEVNKENMNSYKDWNLLDEHIKKNKMITLISKFTEGIISNEELLRLQQQMLFWGEDYILNIAPRMTERPFALSFDHNAEELSFSTIYYGQPKTYSSAIHVIPFMQVTSKLQCWDHQGIHSDHILYFTGKIMHLQIIDSFNMLCQAKHYSEIKRRHN